MKNLTLLQIIKIFEEQTIIAFVTVKNPVTKAVSSIDKIIKQIGEENDDIERYFEELTQHKDKMLEYNRDIIESLEMFQRYEKDKER